MKEKIYSNQEMAEQLGIELEPFMDLMVELGLLSNNVRPTEFAIKNGLLAEKSTISQEKEIP
jgi:hypothetical protein